MRWIPCLFALACTPTGPLSPMDTQAVPVGGLELDVDGRLVSPNATLDFHVTGATPGTRVFLVRGNSRSDDATCPAALGGACADIVSPTVIGSRLADAAGEARFSSVETPRPNHAIRYYQAAAVGQISPVRGRWEVRPNRFMGVERNLTVSAPGGVASGLVGDFSVLFYGGGQRDACRLVADVAGVAGTPTIPPCPNCPFTFELTLDNWRDESDLGDCLDLLGIDPFAVSAETWGIGFTNGLGFTSYNMRIFPGYNDRWMGGHDFIGGTYGTQFQLYSGAGYILYASPGSTRTFDTIHTLDY
jgi:hypothetical protein